MPWSKMRDVWRLPGMEVHETERDLLPEPKILLIRDKENDTEKVIPQSKSEFGDEQSPISMIFGIQVVLTVASERHGTF